MTWLLATAVALLLVAVGALGLLAYGWSVVAHELARQLREYAGDGWADAAELVDPHHETGDRHA